MGTNRYAGQGTSESFGTKGAVITPGATDLAVVSKGLLVVAAGNVTFIPVGNEDGESLTFTGAVVGQLIPYMVRRVTAATATVWAIYD